MENTDIPLDTVGQRTTYVGHGMAFSVPTWRRHGVKENAEENAETNAERTL